MKKPIYILTLLAIVLLTTQITPIAQAELEGRYRIYLMSGRYIEGDVVERADGSYAVKGTHGITTIIKKHEVKNIVPLEEVRAYQGETGSDEDELVALLRRQITDKEIEEILAGIVAEPDEAFVGAAGDLAAPLPLDEESLLEMLEIAGVEREDCPIEEQPGVMLKAHYVMVYTSSVADARKLMSRVESIYRWKVKFMKMMDYPAVRPDYKLEIFFFGHHNEFLATGGSPDAGGYYQPDSNRAFFFNFETHPMVIPAAERSKDKNVPWRERQRLRNRVRRFVERNNLEVIQHEVGHQIDFNIGLFPRDGLRRATMVPIWIVEGTTTMFEVPPNTAGASLGVMNDYRLMHLRRVFGRHPLSLDMWRQVLFDPMRWFNNSWGVFNSYSLGWAMTYYLWKNERAGYAKFCKAVTDRDPDREYTMTEREKEFEDIFGRVDQAWLDKFYEFLDTLNVRRSLVHE